ncbi:cytochrome P450 family monooxygenase (macronuclear) [Tetrahymena thermophila SB210]|uniref:Cytochrome P450 family monooxygenase n=2 Tax=Tetrahymena thermophila TaxID=5911 RepID=Q22NI8_TETTS|nr:cytochrome P450 family monooxygenase [Tetrahymena thermophila SB210]EAR86797.2 cytochrome P450 family monooxygenase [Tetrahymena thermophila SB210]|eukprot:XP_001007042.2 cytochrome P450 family monooxygenase [Tetrahymena thermophila SB210]
MRNLHQKNLKALAFNFSTKVCISFLDPMLIKQFHQNHDAFKKVDVSMAITYLFGDSIIFARGKQWQRQRQFLGKSFHFEEIKNYLPQIKQISENVFGNINLNGSENEEICAVQICQKVTSEVVFQIFFGSTSQNLVITTQKGHQIKVAEELISAIVDSMQIFETDKIALLKWIFLEKNSTKYFTTKSEKQLKDRLIAIKQACLNVIKKRNDQLSQDISLVKQNFLDLYLIEMITNQNTQITYEEIIDNYLTLFFAGTDTTGNMTGVALYYLSVNPQIQEQARDEILQKLSQKTASKDPKYLFDSFSFDDLASLNLLNSILKESLRLIPPAIDVFPREAVQDIKIGEFEIKKGDIVTSHFIYNQSNNEIFSNPDIFDPQRWMNGKEQQNAYNFTPFSLGPRNCIGQHLAMIEGKCMLVYILLNYQILPNTNQQLIRENNLVYGFKKDNLIFFKKIIL